MYFGNLQGVIFLFILRVIVIQAINNLIELHFLNDSILINHG